MKKFSLLILLTMFSSISTAQVSLMTYNIKYANENDGENSWSQRKDWLANQIAFHEPDIFGVQEALLEQLQFLKAELKQYDYLGKSREGGEDGEYSAIFYDSSRFEVLEQGTFWLSETPDSVSQGWDAAYKRICTYALFKDRQTEQKFWVFNTHFDHRGDVARSESAKLIIDKISELNQEGQPLVLMGDLNLEPASEPLALLSSEFNDAWESSTGVVFGPVGTFNAYEFLTPVTRRIDYIFTDKDSEVLKYGVLSDSKELRYPSDHLPVLVEVSFSEAE